MTAEEKMLAYIEGLTPLFQAAMLYAHRRGDDNMRRKFQLSYIAALELLAEVREHDGIR